MACCAFAIYLVSQLLLPLRWLRDRLFGAPAPVASASVAWSPAAAPGSATIAPRRRWRPLLLLVALAELAGLGVAATAASRTPAPGTPPDQFFTALHSSICSAVGLSSRGD